MLDAAIEHGTFDPESDNYGTVPEGCPLSLWRLWTSWAETQEGPCAFLMNEVDDGPPLHLRGPWPGLVFGPDAKVTIICDDAFATTVKRHPASEVTLLHKAHHEDYTTVNGKQTASRDGSLTWYLREPCVATLRALMNRGERIYANAYFRAARDADYALPSRGRVYHEDGDLRVPFDEEHLLLMADYVRVQRTRVTFNPRGPMCLFDERGRYVGPSY